MKRDTTMEDEQTMLANKREVLPRRDDDPAVVEAARALHEARTRYQTAKAHRDDAWTRAHSTTPLTMLKGKYDLPEAERGLQLAEAAVLEAEARVRAAREAAVERLRPLVETRLRERLRALDAAYGNVALVYDAARAVCAEAAEAGIGRPTDFDLLGPTFFLPDTTGPGPFAMESGLTTWRRVLRRDGYL